MVQTTAEPLTLIATVPMTLTSSGYGRLRSGGLSSVSGSTTSTATSRLALADGPTRRSRNPRASPLGGSCTRSTIVTEALTRAVLADSVWTERRCWGHKRAMVTCEPVSSGSQRTDEVGSTFTGNVPDKPVRVHRHANGSSGGGTEPDRS